MAEEACGKEHGDKVVVGDCCSEMFHRTGSRQCGNREASEVAEGRQAGNAEEASVQEVRD